PVLAAALGNGGLSFSKIKILTRIVNVDDDTDQVLAASAAAGTVADVDRMYQHWKLHDEQHKPPTERRRGTRVVQTLSRHDGLAAVDVRIAVEDEQRLMHLLDPMVRSEAVDKDPRGASSTAPGDSPEASPWTQRRADALVDLLEAGLAHLQRDG